YIAHKNSTAVRINNRTVRRKVVREHAFGNDFGIVVLAPAKKLPGFGDEIGSVVVFFSHEFGRNAIAPDHHFLCIELAGLRTTGTGELLASINHRENLKVMEHSVAQPK